MAVSVKKDFNSQLSKYILMQENAKVIGLVSMDEHLHSDNSGATLLHYAAEYGNAVITRYLIELGCNIDALDEAGRSPLMLAVTFNRVDTIAVLLEANASVTVRDNIGRTILESVLQPGAVTRSTDVVNLFLNKVIDMCSDDDTSIANALMEARCNLIKAIALDRPGVTRVMLENGCSIEDRDVDCNTALHVAVERMNLDNVKLLVRHGARVNARGSHGRPALSLYDMKFENAQVKLAILKLLLDRGASLTLQDLFGMTPLIFLLNGGDRETLQLVMQYGVDLHGYNRFGQNPLHYLVDNRNPGVLEAIRGKSFDVDARNSQGFTPLLLAVKNYDKEKIEFLLEHGADVNAKSADGHTALILLFMNRLEDERNIGHIVELLLRRGADAEATLKNGVTIFDLAAQYDYFYRVKPVIGELAMSEAQGKSIDDAISCKINGNLVFKHHYEKCREQLRKLRYKIVHGSVSLYKLLFESERKLALYARNRDFAAKFARSMARASNLDSYILDAMRRRVDEAVRVAKLRESSAFAICRVSGLPISTCHTVLYRIVDCLIV